MNYGHSPHSLSQHIFRPFHQKLFFFCRINSQALLMCTFWRWKSLLRDPQSGFFMLPLLFLLTHRFTQDKQKNRACLSQRSEEGSGRSDSPGQTVRCGSVSLQLMACQHEVTEQTGQPLPLRGWLCLAQASCNSPLERQAWDGDYDLGWKGLQRPERWQRMGQEGKETGRNQLTLPFLSAAVRDVLDQLFVPTADSQVKRSHTTTAPIDPLTYMNIKVTHVYPEQCGGSLWFNSKNINLAMARLLLRSHLSEEWVRASISSKTAKQCPATGLANSWYFSKLSSQIMSLVYDETRTVPTVIYCWT